MTYGTTEAEVIQNLIPELEEEGYEVFVHPRPPVLPAFLRNFAPDIIANRKGKHLAVEIVRSLETSSHSLEKLTSAIRENPDWALRIVVISSTSPQSTLPSQSWEAIQSSIEEVRRLINSGSYEASLLVGWAVLEAIGRHFLPEELARPQSPGRLLQVLAHEGYLTPSEADWVRSLAKKRNEFIHGRVETTVSKQEMTNFIVILENLASVKEPH
jgi:uncharacterized protein YutE (UPF0331/DUF86 family)